MVTSSGLRLDKKHFMDVAHKMGQEGHPGLGEKGKAILVGLASIFRGKEGASDVADFQLGGRGPQTVAPDITPQLGQNRGGITE